MSRGMRWAVIAAAVILVLLLLAALINITNRPRGETFTIASWNLQVFGDSKEENARLMGIYEDKIESYDIVFVQEIRDADGSSFLRLCYLLQNHSCRITSRAGRTSSKEQYGVIYRSVGPRNFTLSGVTDFNPDPADRWERPPVRAVFSTGNATHNYTLVAYNIHIRPSAAAQELAELERLVAEDEQGLNIVVLGDLNADCGYYDPSRKNAFAAWHWLIGDGADTTSGRSSCAYDRIIAGPEALEEYVESGVDSAGIAADVSDHYLVWAAFAPYER